MGCGCGKNNNPKPRPMFPVVPAKPAVSDNKEIPKVEQSKPTEKKSGVIGNMIMAARSQENKTSWFKDGLTGIAKCIGGKNIYSDEDIQKNRDVCRNCDDSTKFDGKLTLKSQCMAIDPNTGEACGCFIVCKTQVGKCPLNKWTTIPLTVSAKGTE